MDGEDDCCQLFWFFYNVDCVVLEDGIVQEAPVCFL